VNNDLERMADLAVNIAERAVYLADHDPIPSPPDLVANAERVQAMVRKGLDSLVERDPVRARETVGMDDAVDAAHRRIYAATERTMRERPETVDRGVQVLSVSHNLERIADLATNIAEDVVFMVEGEVIRHRHDVIRGEG
jgi:phosphate transport system protein